MLKMDFILNGFAVNFNNFIEIWDNKSKLTNIKARQDKLCQKTL